MQGGKEHEPDQAENGLIFTECDSSDYCTPTNREIAAFLRISESRTQFLLSELEEFGLIKRVLIKDDNGEVLQRRIYLMEQKWTQKGYDYGSDRSADRNI